MRLKNGPTETPECWSLKFQTEAIFAENVAIFADNFPKFADYLDIQGKLSANMAAVLILRVQRSVVSAGLLETKPGLKTAFQA